MHCECCEETRDETRPAASPCATRTNACSPMLLGAQQYASAASGIDGNLALRLLACDESRLRAKVVGRFPALRGAELPHTDNARTRSHWLWQCFAVCVFCSSSSVFTRHALALAEAATALLLLLDGTLRQVEDDRIITAAALVRLSRTAGRYDVRRVHAARLLRMSVAWSPWTAAEVMSCNSARHIIRLAANSFARQSPGSPPGAGWQISVHPNSPTSQRVARRR